MTKSEFIKLQQEDIATLDNSAYNAILQLFKEYIPVSAVIGNDKSVIGMYKKMEEYARKNKGSSNCYCIDSLEMFKKIMIEYLQITPKKEKSLEDYF